MYPTIVIVLVETQRSMTDICEISSSGASGLAGPVASDHEAHAATLRHNLSHTLLGKDVQERDLEKVPDTSMALASWASSEAIAVGVEVAGQRMGGEMPKKRRLVPPQPARTIFERRRRVGLGSVFGSGGRGRSESRWRQDRMGEGV